MSTYWQDDEPATEQQLRRLKELGFVPANPLTVTEAARLIRQYQRNPLRAGEPDRASVSTVPVGTSMRTPAKTSPPPAGTGALPGVHIRESAVPSRLNRAPTTSAAPIRSVSENDISRSTRQQAAGLREAYEKAKLALTTTPNAPNVRADFAVATTRRQEFWVDTCRDSREMQIGSVQVFELYQNYGCRFYPPTREQAQIIFDALDAVAPSWDHDHPELFHQTLELNFPDLVRR